LKQKFGIVRKEVAGIREYLLYIISSELSLALNKEGL